MYNPHKKAWFTTDIKHKPWWNTWDLLSLLEQLVDTNRPTRQRPFPTPWLMLASVNVVKEDPLFVDMMFQFKQRISIASLNDCRILYWGVPCVPASFAQHQVPIIFSVLEVQHCLLTSWLDFDPTSAFFANPYQHIIHVWLIIYMYIYVTFFPAEATVWGPNFWETPTRLPGAMGCNHGVQAEAGRRDHAKSQFIALLIVWICRIRSKNVDVYPYIHKLKS